ncbi:protease, putative [Plasmodium gallinaceum]|uniref:Protease, putative n=1 Tax=Plasmodium gallinaceum TaxID=5849 RepID=A0A1J1GW72_PLAGA|nr:protease, putative [Plasmodium gallinaceum]CRG96683.1 protease, putative [Plasmodium gallinaceum]
MMVKLFCFSIFLWLCVKSYNIKKTQIITNRYGIVNKNGVNYNVLKKKKFYNYSKLKIYSSKEKDSGNGKYKNIIRKYIFNFCLKNSIYFTNSLEYIKNILRKTKEMLFKNSLKKQIFISVSFFFIHFYLLSKHFLILFPYQLIPNHSNILMSLDLNNTLFILTSLYFLKDIKKNIEKFKQRLNFKRFKLELQENKKKNILSISVLLIASYILSGYVSLYTENILNFLKVFKFSVSDNIIKSLQILSGHFMWVVCSIIIIRRLLYPYFKHNKSNLNFLYKESWYFKVIYGYMFSHFIFNIIDVFNNIILNYFHNNEIHFDNSIDEIVNEKELISTILCIISPCFSAPFFEEYIYRFFVLKSLNLFMNIHYSVIFSSLFFAIHHLNIFNLLPLFFLSFFWSYIYIYTDNILVTMLIHSFWNLYVFLTSLYN